jgi:hypothetical protein
MQHAIVAKKFKIFSLVLIQMIIAVILGILFIFVLNNYYSTNSFKIILNMGNTVNNQNLTKDNHQEFNINLNDFENKRTAQGNINLTSTVEKYSDLGSFLDNFFGFNKRELNAHINLQLSEKVNNSGQDLVSGNSIETDASNTQFYGQVLPNGLNLRRGPSLNSEVFYVLNRGEIVKVFGKIGQWLMVYSPSKKLTGSVYSEFIEPME